MTWDINLFYNILKLGIAVSCVSAMLTFFNGGGFAKMAKLAALLMVLGTVAVIANDTFWKIVSVGQKAPK